MSWQEQVLHVLRDLDATAEEFKCTIFGYKRGGLRKIDVEPAPRVKVQ